VTDLTTKELRDATTFWHPLALEIFLHISCSSSVAFFMVDLSFNFWRSFKTLMGNSAGTPRGDTKEENDEVLERDLLDDPLSIANSSPEQDRSNIPSTKCKTFLNR
jgi:hypothetical protein